MDNPGLESDFKEGRGTLSATQEWASRMSIKVPKIRIFLSSPGDVSDERAIARRVIEDLPYDPLIRSAISFEIVAWEMPGAPGLQAQMPPQQAIELGLPKPSDCDIVVGILWTRIGTPFEMNGERYRSGTIYELEDAKKGAGNILIYRRREKVYLNPEDPHFQEKFDQWSAVNDYFKSFQDDSGAAIGGYNSYQSPSDFEDLLSDHLKNILVQSYLNGAPENVEVVRWPGSPFPGLRAFTTVDAPIFFGRGRETDELVRKVGEQRVVFVMGASGSGKSSLVGAGLLPRIKDGALANSSLWLAPEFDAEQKRWRGGRFTPAEHGGSPFTGLIEQFSTFKARLMDGLARELCSEPWRIDQVVNEVCGVGETLLLFVDQFEELFTSVSQGERIGFVQLLCHPNPKLRWVITVRSDFYHRCVDIPELARLLEKGQFPLSAPTETLLDMITRPAERAGIEFEEGLTWRILEDTGHEPGSLALMAYALDELYLLATRRTDRLMSLVDYDGLGGVQGAIGKRAEGTFASLPGTPAQCAESLHRVFRELVEVDENAVATRRRASMQTKDWDALSRALVDAFVSARLLTTSEGDDGGQVEVAHEALLRSWMRLSRWIESFQSDLKLLRQLKNAVSEWVNSGRNPDYLWQGERGIEAQAMLKRLNPSLNEMETVFARPEALHLLEELERQGTSHIRREAIGQRLLALGDPRDGIGCKDGLPDIAWCRVDGREEGEAEFLDHEGKSFGRYPTLSFHIARYPITFLQFQVFANSNWSADAWWDGFENPAKELPKPIQTGANYPIDSVTWHIAVAYSRWLNEMLPPAMLPSVEGSRNGWAIRLPHEWEWQAAVSWGAPDAPFPWGDWDATRCNLKEAGIGRTVPVGLYPLGAAPCGALDLIGNLREWCLNSHKDPSDVSYGGTKVRALRGGSIYQDHLRALRNYRASMGPSNASRETTIRLVYSRA